MSVTYGFSCLDCRQHAPEVGQGGFLGAPMLAEESTPDFPYGQGMPTFGWLYAGVAGLGIRPYELERHGLFGLPDPEESMDQLIPFVREHESHGLVATLKR